MKKHQEKIVAELTAAWDDWGQILDAVASRRQLSRTEAMVFTLFYCIEKAMAEELDEQRRGEDWKGDAK